MKRVNFPSAGGAPMIVTTTVGFLEGLFACRAPDCRRLHQVANSVVVLDEAQSLPPRLLDATLHTLQELCEHCGCTGSAVYRNAACFSVPPEYAVASAGNRSGPAEAFSGGPGRF